MEKPITLQMENLKKEIVDAINKSNLPVFILDFMLKDLYGEVHAMSQKQFIDDKERYEESLKKEKGKKESA